VFEHFGHIASAQQFAVVWHRIRTSRKFVG
jgi:hypothetical protein